MRAFGSNGPREYWWTVWNSIGELLTGLVSLKRDLSSAKLLFRAKESMDFVGQKTQLVTTDKFQSYIHGMKILGRKCKHIQTTIRGRFVQFGKKLLF